MSKRICALVLSFVFILSGLSGCSGKDDTSSIITYPISQDPKCLDPQIATVNSANLVINNCFEGLVRIDSGGKIIGGVARNWSVSNDAKTYTFNLRSDAKWYLPADSDDLKELLGDNYEKDFNASVTANDFVFAYKRALSAQTGAPDASSLFIIKNAQKVYNGSLSADELGVRALNDRTLQITLEHPSISFLTVLTMPVCMPCNEAFFNATVGRYGLSASLVLCNGPFYITSWTADKSIVLKRNDQYAGEKPVKPYKITLPISADSTAYISNLAEGTYSAAKITAKEADSITKDDKLTITSTKNIVWAFCFNTAQSTIANTNIRLALCSAVDKNILYDKTSGNKAEGIVPASCMLVAGSSYRANVGMIDAFPFDKSAAKNYWNAGIDQLTKNNVEINKTITLLCTAEYEVMLRKILQDWQSLCDINRTIKIEVLPQDDMMTRMNTGAYDIAFAPFTATEFLAVDFLGRFTTGAYGNVAGYASAEYDKILNTIMTSADESKTVQLCKNAENNLISNGVIYPVYAEKSYFAVSRNLSGLYIYQSGENISFISAHFE